MTPDIQPRAALEAGSGRRSLDPGAEAASQSSVLEEGLGGVPSSRVGASCTADHSLAPPGAPGARHALSGWQHCALLRLCGPKRLCIVATLALFAAPPGPSPPFQLARPLGWAAVLRRRISRHARVRPPSHTTSTLQESPSDLWARSAARSSTHAARST